MKTTLNILRIEVRADVIGLQVKPLTVMLAYLWAPVHVPCNSTPELVLLIFLGKQ